MHQQRTESLRAVGSESISSAHEPRAVCEVNEEGENVGKIMLTAIAEKLVERHLGCLGLFGRCSG